METKETNQDGGYNDIQSRISRGQCPRGEKGHSTDLQSIGTHRH